MTDEKSLDWVEYTLVNGDIQKARERVVVEYGISISLNEVPLTTAIITPMMKEEFVTGYLFGQGIIDTFNDIASLSVNGNKADVVLKPDKTKPKRQNKVTADLHINRDDIFSGINLILKSTLYAETSAIHSAGLFKPGAEPICVAEDVGRHNALDKVIGYALMHGIDFNNTFAASTGRMVSDMVSKICRAHIPIVATKTAVTKLGVEIGEQYGITIIGFVKDIGMKKKTDTGVKVFNERRMNIYTNPYRIL
jgi:FdhD protein